MYFLVSMQFEDMLWLLKKQGYKGKSMIQRLKAYVSNELIDVCSEESKQKQWIINIFMQNIVHETEIQLGRYEGYRVINDVGVVRFGRMEIRSQTRRMFELYHCVLIRSLDRRQTAGAGEDDSGRRGIR